MNDLARQYARQLADFQRNPATGLMTPAAAELAVTQAAADFLACYADNRSYLRDAVTLLSEAAIHSDSQIAGAGIRGLFPLLVEKLSDSFAPEDCLLYDRVFAQVIEFCRQRNVPLHERLLNFGLRSEQDLLTRRTQQRARPIRLADPAKIRKAIFLSRVTLGADVAVTSVMMAAVQQAIPAAELVLCGSHKLKQLFSGNPHIRIREIVYERGGNLLSRLNAWHETASVIADELHGNNEHEVLVIDPDSRLTQLGLLPVVSADKGYYFFESRNYQQPACHRLSELTEHWIKSLMGIREPVFPAIALPQREQNQGSELIRRLRKGGAGHIVCVSLGVGGNSRKRLADPFEQELLHGLLADSTLILDKGGDEEERQQINRLLVSLRDQHKIITEVNEANLSRLLESERIQTEVLTWDGSIGAFAGLIAASDEYVGYDSAGQHIAAASGVPTITIFVNSGSELFAARWHPHGRGVIKVLRVEPEQRASAVQRNLVLADVLRTHHQLR